MNLLLQYIPLALVLVALAMLGIEDNEHMSIGKGLEQTAKAIIIVAFLIEIAICISAYMSSNRFYVEITWVPLGLLAYVMSRNTLEKIMMPLDREIIALTLLAVPIIPFIALSSYFVWHIGTAAAGNKERFPALTHYAITFFIASALVIGIGLLFN